MGNCPGGSYSVGNCPVGSFPDTAQDILSFVVNQSKYISYEE